MTPEHPPVDPAGPRGYLPVMGPGWRGFYAIVDPDCCAGRDPEQVGRAILGGGCAVLQLRAKRLADRERLELARRLSAHAHRAGVPFVMNDRPDLAVLSGADGLHLGQRDLPVAEARRVVGPLPIGLSTHDADQARDAVARGADLIGFGPIFETRSKERPDPVVGLEQLQAVCRQSPVPVIAIGGLTPERATHVARAGAQLVAAIAAVCGAEDPARAARGLHEAGGAA